MFLILGVLSLLLSAHGLPIDNKSVYDVIQLSASADKCPYVRETKLVQPEPEFLKPCKDFASARHITALDNSNLEDALCLLYYNSFMYLCTVSDSHQKQIKEILTNSSIDGASSRYKTEEVCDILKKDSAILDNEYKESMQAILLSIQQNEAACDRMCSDFDGKVSQICSVSAYMLNATSTLLTLKPDGKVTKPSHTEHMEHNSGDTQQQAAQSHSEQVAATKNEQPANPAGKQPPQPSSQEKPQPSNDKGTTSFTPPSATDTKKLNEPEAAPKNQDPQDADLPAKQPKGGDTSPSNSGSEPASPPLPVAPEPEAPVPPEGAKGNSQPAPNSEAAAKTPAASVPDEKSSPPVPPNLNKPPEASSPKEESAPNPKKGDAQPEAISEVAKAAPEQPKSAVEAPVDNTGGVEVEAPDVNSINKENNDEGLNQMDTAKLPEEGVDGDPDFIADGEGDLEIPLPGEEGDDNLAPAAKASGAKQPVENLKPHEVNEDGILSPVNSKSINMDDNDSYFFSYFMMVCIMFICGYVAYHNKQKILALVVEGRQGRRPSRTRRPNSANYRKLDSNLEEAITSSCKKNTTQVIY